MSKELSSKKDFRGVSFFSFVLIVFLFNVFFVNYTQAIEYGGIGGRPAYPRADNPRTESIFVHTLKPGENKDEGVLLVNNSSEKKNILVYAVDSIVSSGGAFSCRQMTEPKSDVGNWITLDKEEVTINPGANELVPFKIKTPENASVGEHNGCIVIQEKKNEDPANEQAGVNLSFRTGLRVIVSVPGEIVRKLEVVDFTLEKQKNGNVLLKPVVKNSGNVSIDANVKVVTKNLFGASYLEQGGGFPVLRGETSEWNFEIKKPFWGGLYKSNLAVEYQKDSNTEIGKISSQPKEVINGKTVTIFFMPSMTAMIIEIFALLVVIFFLFLLIIKAKRKSWIKNNWQDLMVRDGDDIKMIADRLHVSWKLLVKVNKLKAPYTIKSGQKIKAPTK